jgi:hypothetical protein
MEQEESMEHENPVGESFLESVRVGDLPSVTRLLRQTPHLANVADRVGWYFRRTPPPPSCQIELMAGLDVSRTGLMTAVAARHVAMAKLLLAHGADPHRRSPTDGMHALHVLAEQGPRDFSSTDSVNPLHPRVLCMCVCVCARVFVWPAFSVCMRACTT